MSRPYKTDPRGGCAQGIRVEKDGQLVGIYEDALAASRVVMIDQNSVRRRAQLGGRTQTGFVVSYVDYREKGACG